MSEKEFDEKWEGVDTDALTDEEFLQFKNDCFELYETTGFSKKFHSPYDETYNLNGKPFKVLRRATEKECDIEAMPIWVVKFKGIKEPFYCYPEEICKIEER